LHGMVADRLLRDLVRSRAGDDRESVEIWLFTGKIICVNGYALDCVMIKVKKRIIFSCLLICLLSGCAFLGTSRYHSVDSLQGKHSWQDNGLIPFTGKPDLIAYAKGDIELWIYGTKLVTKESKASQNGLNILPNKHQICANCGITDIFRTVNPAVITALPSFET